MEEAEYNAGLGWEFKIVLLHLDGICFQERIIQILIQESSQHCFPISCPLLCNCPYILCIMQARLPTCVNEDAFHDNELQGPIWEGYIKLEEYKKV